MSRQITLDNEDALDFKIRQTTQIIEGIVKRNNPSMPIVVNFSGGKDSMVVLDIARKVTSNFICFYMISGIEFPDAITFAEDQCRKLDVKLLMSKPEDYKGGFFERLPKIGYFPTVQNNTLWCNRDLKIRPQQKILKKVYGSYHFFKLNGVRRFESSRRKKIHQSTHDFMMPDYHVGNATMVFPILNWTDENVVEYLKRNSIRVQKSPLYAKYGVSGCYWCPFYQMSIYKRILSVDPDIYDRFIEAEKQVKRPSVNGRVFLSDLKKAVCGGCTNVAH